MWSPRLGLHATRRGAEFSRFLPLASDEGESPAVGGLCVSCMNMLLPLQPRSSRSGKILRLFLVSCCITNLHPSFGTHSSGVVWKLTRNIFLGKTTWLAVSIQRRKSQCLAPEKSAAFSCKPYYATDSSHPRKPGPRWRIPSALAG